MFLFLFFLLNILLTKACRVKVGILNKSRPPIINWEDWSIIHYYNTMLCKHTADVLLSNLPITNQGPGGGQSYVCCDSPVFSLGTHQMSPVPRPGSMLNTLCLNYCSAPPIIVFFLGGQAGQAGHTNIIGQPRPPLR